MRIKSSVVDLLDHENKAKANGFRFVFGVDEAGRGPLAGPVIAAAVFLRDTNFKNRIADSKVLSAVQRERAFGEIYERGFVGIGMMNEVAIDQLNILRASHLAMAMAVHDLAAHLPRDIREEADFNAKVKVLIDGNSFTGQIPYALELIVKGDAKSMSIACASIVAKVTRDRIIGYYDKIYPQYGFKQHKGYPTEAHRAAIKVYGPSPIHRKSFRVK